MLSNNKENASAGMEHESIATTDVPKDCLDALTGMKFDIGSSL